MSDGAAQGADGGAAAAREPTVLDDGFTPEERAAFAEMEAADQAANTGGGDAGGAAADQGGAAAAAVAGGEGKAGGAAEGAAGAAAGNQAGKQIASDDDDADDEAAAGAQGQQGQAGQDGNRPPRRVNWNKYAREKERADTAEKRAKDMEEMFTRTDERLKLLNDALSGANQRKQEQAENQDPEPDKEKDAFGWMNWAGRQLANMQKLVSEQTQSRQASNDEQAVADSYVTDVRRFIADPENKDGKNFAGAYTFLMDQRMGELALYYYSLDIVSDDGKVDKTKLSVDQERRLKAEIAAEERELVTNAIAAKQSPAMAVYRMARARGFRPVAAAAAGAANGAGAGAGAANGAGGGKAPGSLAEGAGGATNGQQGGQARQPGQTQPSVAEEIAKVRNGQAANVSLSNGAGSPGQQTLTPERLANMSQAEFNELMETIGDAGFQRIVEGATA